MRIIWAAPRQGGAGDGRSGSAKRVAALSRDAGAGSRCRGKRRQRDLAATAGTGRGIRLAGTAACPLPSSRAVELYRRCPGVAPRRRDASNMASQLEAPSFDAAEIQRATPHRVAAAADDWNVTDVSCSDPARTGNRGALRTKEGGRFRCSPARPGGAENPTPSRHHSVANGGAATYPCAGR